MQDPVQREVAEDLLALLDRFKSALRTTTISNQQTIEAVKTLRVDVKKLREQQSELPNRTGQDSDRTPTTRTRKNQQQPGSSSEDPTSQKLRARARMETFDFLFSTGLPPNFRPWNVVCSSPTISRTFLLKTSKESVSTFVSYHRSIPKLLPLLEIKYMALPWI